MVMSMKNNGDNDKDNDDTADNDHPLSNNSPSLLSLYQQSVSVQATRLSCTMKEKTWL
jgi:hypothetical protein